MSILKTLIICGTVVLVVSIVAKYIFIASIIDNITDEQLKILTEKDILSSTYKPPIKIGSISKKIKHDKNDPKIEKI